MAYGNGGGQSAVMLGGGGAQQLQNMKQAGGNNIGDELTMQDKRAEELHMALTELESKLSPILQSVPPQAGTGTGTDLMAQGSAVVSMLRAQGYKIEAAIERVRDLARRAEL